MKNVGQMSGALAKLHGVIEALERSWAVAREDWDDSTSQNFDNVHVQPILRELKEIVESTAPVSDCLGQARRACEPDRAG